MHLQRLRYYQEDHINTYFHWTLKKKKLELGGSNFYFRRSEQNYFKNINIIYIFGGPAQGFTPST